MPICTTSRKCGIFGNTMEMLMFDLLICWKYPGTNHRQKCCDVNAIPMCSVMEWNVYLQCLKLKIHGRIYSNASFLNTLLKTSHTFQGIHHYIVNLGKLCVYLIIHCWHHAKFATGCWTTIWVLKQIERRVWLRWVKVPSLVIWYPDENLLLLYKSYLFKV